MGLSGMNRDMRWSAAVFCVAGLGLFGGLRTWGDTEAAARGWEDVYRLAAREELLRGGLEGVPAGARVGFFTDAAAGSGAETAMLQATQWAAAPRLLVEGGEPRPEWWLGCFTRPMNFEGEGRRRGLRMVRDLGGGVVLFRVEGK